MTGETLKLTETETITVRSAAPEGLEVEVTYGPAGHPPPKHFHPSQSERFEVLEGTLRTKVDGAERDLAAGETIEIPAGAVHQMWNPFEAEARASWTTTPAGRTLEWFRAIDTLVTEHGKPGPRAFAPLLVEYEDVFRIPGPQPLVRGALRLVARLPGS